MNAATTGLIPGSTGAKVASAAVFLFVTLIVVFAINSKYHFLPEKWDLFKHLGLVKSQDATFWTNVNTKTTLSVDKKQLPPNFPNSYGYSMMFDIMVYNSRASYSTTTGGTLPYRHILHRGSDDLGSAGTSSGCGGGGSSTPGSPGTGLPKLMNPGFLGDPMTNDILLYITTSAGLESARISNFQLATPYRIGIIVYKEFFELYLGCKLVTTQLLKGIPVSVNSSGVHALAGPFAMNAKIQNLRLWSTTLPIQQIITECSTPIQSFGPPPPCITVPSLNTPPIAGPGAGSAAGIASSTNKAAAATIGSVTQCPSTR